MPLSLLVIMIILVVGFYSAIHYSVKQMKVSKTIGDKVMYVVMLIVSCVGLGLSLQGCYVALDDFDKSYTQTGVKREMMSVKESAHA